jgi:endonuclease YncB( thermonuclease family)
MLKNIFFLIIGFLIGVFIVSSLSWRDIQWDNLKDNPWQEIMRLRAIISEKTPEDTHSAYVTKIVDGDTVIIEGGKQVRLLGVDAAEKGETCYQEAKDYLEDLVLKKEVTLISDANDKDQYGRLLRYLQIDGKNINIALAKQGMVSLLLMPEVTIYRADLVVAEQYAKNNKLGCLWEETEE